MLTEMILMRAAFGMHSPNEHRYAQFICGARARWRFLGTLLRRPA